MICTKYLIIFIIGNSLWIISFSWMSKKAMGTHGEHRTSKSQQQKRLRLDGSAPSVAFHAFEDRLNSEVVLSDRTPRRLTTPLQKPEAQLARVVSSKNLLLRQNSAISKIQIKPNINRGRWGNAYESKRWNKTGTTTWASAILNFLLATNDSQSSLNLRQSALSNDISFSVSSCPFPRLQKFQSFLYKPSTDKPMY